MQDSARVLLDALLVLSRERDDVRRSLATLNAWLARELERAASDSATTTDARRLPQKVLVPRGRQGARRADEEEGPRRPVRDVDLSRVVRRARWKAAACRFAADRRAAQREGRSEDPELRRIEEGLRARREKLDDAPAWMLDPQDARLTDERLRLVASAYDVLAVAAETTVDLLEAGALDDGPPSELLYLLAEAQSALLAALEPAGVRADSDQRDVFLWLKDRTTRHRIYVDRYMRLEDPADPTAGADLERRLRAAGERFLAQHRSKRQRTQLLNKVRYHVRKLVDGGALSDSEWASIGGAVDRWREAGLPLDDRDLLALLRPLTTERLRGRRPSPALAAALRARAGAGEDDAAREAGRTANLEEARRLLDGGRALLFVPSDAEVDGDALASELSLASVRVLPLDLDADAAARTVALDEGIGTGDVDVVLIGVRLPREEYGLVKAACLERELPFVRLPGALAPSAVAHQILRQVGWRLRERGSRRD